MKSTTVSGLRDNYSQVLNWVASGEEVEVTCRGKPVAKLVPVAAFNSAEVDWSKSAALNRKPWVTVLSAKQSAIILAES